MKDSEHNILAVIDQANEWIERLQGDGNAASGESEAFFDWLTESPRHVEVFMQALTLQQRIGAIGSEQWTALKDTAGRNLLDLHEPANVVQMDVRPFETSKFPRKRGWQWLAVAAGVVIVILAGTILRALLGGWQNYATAIGEQRAVQLPDGSLVTLNTGSHVRVRMTATARDIQLIDGEALFKVHQDSRRSFRVHTADATIQAIGTQFNVHRQDTGTTVSVLEGRVRVAPGQDGKIATKRLSLQPAVSGAISGALSAGEQAVIGTDGKVIHRAALNTERVTAWQQRRLIFDEETLANIAAEFNRYNSRHFRIDDTQAATRRFSGIFDADDPESLAQLLSRDGGLDVARGDAQIVIGTASPGMDGKSK